MGNLSDFDGFDPDDKAVVAPTFKCTIPETVLEKLSKRDQHVLTALNIMAQQIDWITAQIIHVDGRVLSHGRLLTWVKIMKLLFFSRWSPIVWLLSIVLPWLVNKLLKFIWP